MQKEWFVVQTLTGQEMKVREGLLRCIKMQEMEDYIDEVVVPTEKVTEVKRGVKTTQTRKFFPGYVLVHVALYDDERQMVEKTWTYVRETPGVIGFVGGEKPAPLFPDEVDRVLNQTDEKKAKARPKVEFEAGETLKIIDGPFLNFSGVVEEVDPERGKLKVSVAIFGRSAPVELEYWQVERV
ncbi:MAG: transcription termination/antitermination factor NusG [Lentisphaerae bacterium]|nr:transcription termination/antitermination factor NusG [Lentisphaerota bacterium]